jgi:mannobiose 2-epimerase
MDKKLNSKITNGFRLGLILTRYIFFSVFILWISGCYSWSDLDNQKITEEIEKSLQTELLDAWYPVTLDTACGGFLSDLTFDWHPYGPQNKMLVTQSRHVWTTSKAAVFYKGKNYQKMAEHGFHFLRDKMWDEIHGGFYMLRNRKGDSIDIMYRDEKRAYGNAFAIYALTAYYTMSGDFSALELAKKTFFWLEKHSYDHEYKGYFDAMTRDGSWLWQSDFRTAVFDSSTTSYKDFNSAIHLLEAFTELYRVWQDSLLCRRLSELFFIIRDTMTDERGYLVLFWNRDWTPVSLRDSSETVREKNFYLDHISFGHDMETAYLMLEALHVLQIKPDIKTLSLAKRMVDHSLAKGWDKKKGGFFNQGYYIDNMDSFSLLSEQKSWWVQAEGLNALLLMSKLFSEEDKYRHSFKKQWNYIRKYLIDHQHGGWYIFGLDKNPEAANMDKGYIWKANYHEMRALCNCLNMLKSECELLQTL